MPTQSLGILTGNDFEFYEQVEMEFLLKINIKLCILFVVLRVSFAFVQLFKLLNLGGYVSEAPAMHCASPTFGHILCFWEVTFFLLFFKIIPLHI